MNCHMHTPVHNLEWQVQYKLHSIDAWFICFYFDKKKEYIQSSYQNAIIWVQKSKLKLKLIGILILINWFLILWRFSFFKRFKTVFIDLRCSNVNLGAKVNLLLAWPLSVVFAIDHVQFNSFVCVSVSVYVDIIFLLLLSSISFVFVCAVAVWCAFNKVYV